MMSLFFFFLTFIAAFMGIKVWSIYNRLIPLKHEVEGAKANVIAYQQTAIALLVEIRNDVAVQCNYERLIIDQYLETLRKGLEANASSGSLFSLLNSISPPESNMSGILQLKIQEMSRLQQEFFAVIREYNAATTALNTQKSMFPANLANDRFFDIPDGLYLEQREQVLLPAGSVQKALESSQFELPKRTPTSNER